MFIDRPLGGAVLVGGGGRLGGHAEFPAKKNISSGLLISGNYVIAAAEKYAFLIRIDTGINRI